MNLPDLDYLNQKQVGLFCSDRIQTCTYLLRLIVDYLERQNSVALIEMTIMTDGWQWEQYLPVFQSVCRAQTTFQLYRPNHDSDTDSIQALMNTCLHAKKAQLLMLSNLELMYGYAIISQALAQLLVERKQQSKGTFICETNPLLVYRSAFGRNIFRNLDCFILAKIPEYIWQSGLNPIAPHSLIPPAHADTATWITVPNTTTWS